MTGSGDTAKRSVDRDPHNYQIALLKAKIQGRSAPFSRLTEFKQPSGELGEQALLPGDRGSTPNDDREEGSEQNQPWPRLPLGARKLAKMKNENKVSFSL